MRAPGQKRLPRRIPLPSVLAIDPGTPRALLGRSLLGENLTVEIAATAVPWLLRASEDMFDLLVLSGMSVDEQQEIVVSFHATRRWRLVPVLYVAEPHAPGLAIRERSGQKS